MAQTILTKLNNPFNLDDRDIKRLELAEAVSLQSFLDENIILESDMEYHASINGRVFQPDEIPFQMVLPGDSVAVCPVIAGGGDKNPLAIVAGIALAVFSFGVVSPFIGGMFGSVAGTLAGGATMMLGGQLISNAFSPSLDGISTQEKEVSYNWGNLQPITEQGAVIPITYGTVRVAGQVLNQYVRSVTSDDGNHYQDLYMLLSGGEGPIDSYTDFRINDNPAENYSATIETRPGDNTQAILEGFNLIYNTQNAGFVLECGEKDGVIDPATPGEWHVLELTGDSADYIEVMLTFPSGLGYINPESGELEDEFVAVDFEYRIQSGGAWGAWQSLSTGAAIQAKTTSPFSTELQSGSLHVSGVKIQVRGRMVKKGSTDTSSITSTTWSAASIVMYSPMTHPNKSLVGMRVTATDQLNSGTPVLTWKQTRSKVWVYDGGWVQKDAQNPAWIIYDLCVHARSMDGTIRVFGEDYARMDLARFKQWADWNDRKLNNRPALKMNLLVDESKSLWEWVSDVAASARGAVVMRGTRISCIWDQPSDYVQLFSMGNIIAGSFSGEFLPIESRANAVEISFQNEANNYERETITVYSDGYNDSDTRANPVAVQLTGITDFERAWREGLYRLNQNKYILRTVTFSASVDAIACQVGDVILVQHDVPQWGRGGRIMAINGSTLTLDNEVTFQSGKSYAILIRRQDDSIIQRSVSGSGTTKTITVSGISGVSVYDVFSFGQVEKIAKPFRVQEMSRTSDLVITLTCSEYIAEIYTEADHIPVIDYRDVENGVTQLQLNASGYYSTTGQWIAELWATWSYIGDRPASYQFEYKYNDGTWSETKNVTERKAQVPLSVTGTLYSVRVRALYTTGLPSPWVYATSEGIVLGNGMPPDPPTNLTAEGWMGYANLSWTNPSNIDLSHIEVWSNDVDDLDTAAYVGKTPGTSYIDNIAAFGIRFYWVRAVNYTGQKSAFNSQNGTPCVIAPESHEAFIEELIRLNPWLLERLAELNEAIEDLDVDFSQDIQNIRNTMDEAFDNIRDIKVDVKNILDVDVPSLEARVHDNENSINGHLFPLFEIVGNGLLRLDHEAYRTRNVFRWAGIEINEEEGTVIIRAVEDLKTETGYQFSNVQQTLNAQEAAINLKASRTYVDELAASLISGVVVAQEWKFQNTLNGWTGQNATLAAGASGMKYTITAASPSATSPDISLDGNVNNVVGFQLQQLSGASNTRVIIQYKTASHGYSSSYQKQVTIVGDLSLARSIQCNMHDLTAGGDDWKNSTITGVRLLIGSDVGSVYQINLVNIGQSSEASLALEGLEARITQAEVNIDGALAAIKLKADETVVTKLGTQLNSVSLDLDALKSTVALKASASDLTATTKRVTDAEVKISALEGSISQEVTDFKFIQDQIDDVANAATQNAVNEAEGREARRVALASAKQEIYARITDTNEAVAGYRLELLAAIGENKAAIVTEQEARASADAAEATARQTLATQVNANTAAIQTEQKTRADADSAEASARQALATQVSNNKAAIEAEQRARIEGDNALASDRRTIQAQIDYLAEAATRNAVNEAEGQEARRVALAQAEEELTAQITDAKQASAGYRLELLAKINENNALYQRQINAVATDLSAEVSARELLAVRVSNNLAAIQAEQKARADADTAEASARQLLATEVGKNTAAIETERQARVAADNAEATARQTLATTVSNNTAAIQTEQTARVNGDSANAKSISTLQTTVNGNTTKIQTVQEITNGVKSKYMLRLDTNGYVSGYQLYNGGGQSSFIISADKFLIARPGYTTTRQVFAWDASSGTMSVHNAIIDWAKITNVNVTNAQIANAAISNAKIANATIERAKIANRQLTYTQYVYASISRYAYDSSWISPSGLSISQPVENPCDVLLQIYINFWDISSAADGVYIELHRVYNGSDSTIAWWSSFGAGSEKIYTFVRAWKDACSFTGNPQYYVRVKSYNTVSFQSSSIYTIGQRTLIATTLYR